MSFNGFSNEALRFLGTLGRNNNRAWFLENRALYETTLLEPAKAFVVAMGRRLHEISPDVQADPRINASIRRINRDTRFSPDKHPYKDHFDFFFIYAGAAKEGPGYFLRLMEKKIGIGAGTHRFDKSRLGTFRDAVAGTSGKTLADIIHKLEKGGYSTGGEHYKRVPRGYDSDHERAQLLKHAGLYAFVEMPAPPELSTREFTAFCTRHFKKMAPLSEWLVRHVMPG